MKNLKSLFILFSLLTIPSYYHTNLSAKNTPDNEVDNNKVESTRITSVRTQTKEEFVLSPEIEQIAKTVNNDLNSPIFHTKFILNTKAVQKYIADKHTGNGKKITCITDDNEVINCTYFDRNSDSLVVVGAGFTNNQELMLPFLGIFDCDVAIFDYRGHGDNQKQNLFQPSTWKINPAHFMFGINGKKVKMGEVEEKDVIAVVQELKKQKLESTGAPYKNVSGLGVCYSAMIFVKAQAICPGLFDKLILDGAWLSLERRLEKIRNDPKLMCNPQRGGCYHKWPVGKSWFYPIFRLTIETLSQVRFTNLKVNILDYLPNISIPTICFHCKDDPFVPLEEFDIIWENLLESSQSKDNIAFITTNPHVRNHIKQKELYKLLCNLFLELSYEQFLSYLHDPQLIIDHAIDHKASKYKSIL